MHVNPIAWMRDHWSPEFSCRSLTPRAPIHITDHTVNIASRIHFLPTYSQPRKAKTLSSASMLFNVLNCDSSSRILCDIGYWRGLWAPGTVTAFQMPQTSVLTFRLRAPTLISFSFLATFLKTAQWCLTSWCAVTVLSGVVNSSP